MSIDNIAFNRPRHKALVAYVTIGYPSIEATLQVVPILADGVTPQMCLEIAAQLRSKVKIPLTFMTYINPVFKYGLEQFCHACSTSGIRGLIVPDLPPEEGGELENITQKHGIDLVYLLTPASTKERINLVVGRSKGFIYLVSVTGVTGARTELPSELNQFVARVKKVAKLPLFVGFGISTPEQAKKVTEVADGVIVGSRIIQLMESDSSLEDVGGFVRELRSTLDYSAE
jgi:tryptophan synthase alpha chain